jgi:hypothetical protein
MKEDVCAGIGSLEAVGGTSCSRGILDGVVI